MKFFIEVQNNKPAAQGRIGKQVGPSHFLVRYDAPKKYARMVSLAIMENFAMFDTEDEMLEFVAPPAQPVPAPDVPAGTPEVVDAEVVDVDLHEDVD